MTEKKSTTVNLNVIAQAIKDDLAPVYGLKNILSAGLVLFSRLSATEREELVDTINRENNVVDAVSDESAAARASAKSQRRDKVQTDAKRA